MLLEQDPEYFEAFWTESGYVGHDAPDLVAHDIIDLTTTVDRVVTARDLVSHPDYAGPEYTLTRVMAALMAGTDAGLDLPIAVEIKGIDSGYRLGAGLRMVSGKAKGRQLYCTGCVGDLFSADGRAEANILRFTDVEVGDEVHLDNRKFLAFCYYYRHHVMDDPQFDPKKLMETWTSKIPLGRIGESDEIVGPALFFASDASSMVTGTTLDVDGGYLAQ